MVSAYADLYDRLIDAAVVRRDGTELQQHPR